jgi:hypothetical protein
MGVFVGEGVPVLTGNIKVMAGKGIKVVVAEGVEVTDGVKVCEGVPEVPVGVWLINPTVIV